MIAAEHAEAATVVYSENGPYAGSVAGILGLVVDSKEYNVTFTYGSYDFAYQGMLALSNAAFVTDAINVELNTPSLRAIAVPAGTPMDYRVPVTDTMSGVSYYTSVINIRSAFWERQTSGPFSIDRSLETMWAVVEPDVLPVPIPPAFILMSSALGGLGIISWRRQRKSAA
jgi:hypothetical protein